MVCRSVLRPSPLCRWSSSSVCSIQLQMLFRSELNCCHCCRFCFIRSSLLRAWACRSSQRSMTPAAPPQHHLHIRCYHLHYLLQCEMCFSTWGLRLRAVSVDETWDRIVLIFQLKSHTLHCVYTATTLFQQPHLRIKHVFLFHNLFNLPYIGM